MTWSLSVPSTPKESFADALDAAETSPPGDSLSQIEKDQVEIAKSAMADYADSIMDASGLPNRAASASGSETGSLTLSLSVASG